MSSDDTCINEFNLQCRICLQSTAVINQPMEENENTGLPRHIICSTCQQNCSTAQSNVKIKLEQDEFTCEVTESIAVKDEIKIEDESLQLLEECLNIPLKYESDEDECLNKDVPNTLEKSTTFLDVLALLPYKCNSCTQAFSKECDLRLHESAHSPVSVSCNKTLETRQMLKSQDKPQKKCKKNWKETIHLCEICGKGYVKLGFLVAHMRTHSKHPQVLPDSKRLKRHHLIHTKTKPYKCHLCPKSYTRGESLIIHVRIHTGEMRTHTGEEPHKCLKCDKSFAKIPLLIQHLKVHTEEKLYICSKCGNRYKRYHSLKHHYLRHTTEEPYACDKCTERFWQKRSLIRHLRTHTGENRAEKFYACDKCPKRFRQKVSLTLHLKKTH